MSVLIGHFAHTIMAALLHAFLPPVNHHAIKKIMWAHQMKELWRPQPPNDRMGPDIVIIHNSSLHVGPTWDYIIRVRRGAIVFSEWVCC